jgi:hypothetical protein
MPLQDAWWLCRNIRCPHRRVTIPSLGDETLAVQWLRGFRPDTSKMLQMRSILAAEFGSMGSFRLSDHAVLAQIARLLLSGKVHLHQPSDPFEQAQLRPEGASTKSAPVPRSGRRFTAATPFREPPSDPATFLADIDLQSQAATLMAAAKSGKPFCPE